MINYFNEQISLGKNKKDIMSGLLYRGRDNSRTPMQWNNEKNGGFSSVDDTWIKVNSNYKNINVEEQETDTDSILNYYRELIEIRKKSEVLIYGDYEVIDAENPHVYAYKRFLNNEKLLTILNVSEKKLIFDAKEDLPNVEIIIDNYKNYPEINAFGISLKPFEAIVLKL